MARSHYLIVIALLFLASCGQVGTITGGEKDVTPPTILTEEVQPPMASTEVSPQEITIPYDEYIQLNKPAKNIRVSPDDVTLDYTIKRKSLVLTVKEGEWQPNTTYTITLNRAVQDITEQNDSIVSYAFSTGTFIDSLQTAVQVTDAFTGDPAVDIVVGLYESKLENDTSAIQPRYYTATDKEGIAHFTYLKSRPYFVYAFEDKNRNGTLNKTEKRAFLKEQIEPTDSLITGPTIRLMPPEKDELSVKNNEVLPANRWCISFNKPIHKEEEGITFFSPKPEAIQWNKAHDSITAYYDNQSKQSGELAAILNTAEKQDTLIKKYFFKEKLSLEVVSNIKQQKLLANDSLTLSLNQVFASLDTSKVKFKGTKTEDTVQTSVPYSYQQSSPNEVTFIFDKTQLKEAALLIDPTGVNGISNSLEDTLKLDFKVQQTSGTGVLNVVFDTIPPYGILYLKSKSTNELKQVVFDGVSDTTYSFQMLQPGKYNLHYLIDEDKNGRWTTGSFVENKDAELIYWFKQTSTVRAKWEVKKELSLKK